ncbi:MAG: hypothetical protein K2H01_07770, partial [Ruminococcus sp.]|nr:hypothetical protein [Ruminococcus sp.]
FKEGTNNTSDYYGVYKGYVRAFYNGETLDAKSLVYIGVKGDADLNGKLEIPDATLVLNYYGHSGVNIPFKFTDNEDANYETLAFFLADVDTESKLGKNDDAAGRIAIADATNILTYYGQSGAALNPEWQKVIPSLVDIPNSLWAYKAGK